MFTFIAAAPSSSSCIMYNPILEHCRTVVTIDRVVERSGKLVGVKNRFKVGLTGGGRSASTIGWRWDVCSRMVGGLPPKQVGG